MNKFMLTLVAGCMSAAVASAYAASGSPADTDKAGRAGPGTAAGEMGAAKPAPSGTTGGTGMRRGSPGASSTTGAGAGAGGSAASSTGSGASATTGAGGASATTGSGMDDTSKSGRRARRASKG